MVDLDRFTYTVVDLPADNAVQKKHRATLKTAHQTLALVLTHSRAHTHNIIKKMDRYYSME